MTDKLQADLRFILDIEQEELSHAKVGTGAEVALRHIHRRALEILNGIPASTTPTAEMRPAEEWLKEYMQSKKIEGSDDLVKYFVGWIESIQADALASRADERMPEGWALAEIKVERNDAWCYQSRKLPLTYRALLESNDDCEITGEGPTPRAAVLAALAKLPGDGEPSGTLPAHHSGETKL